MLTTPRQRTLLLNFSLNLSGPEKISSRARLNVVSVSVIICTHWRWMIGRDASSLSPLESAFRGTSRQAFIATNSAAPNLKLGLFRKVCSKQSNCLILTFTGGYSKTILRGEAPTLSHLCTILTGKLPLSYTFYWKKVPPSHTYTASFSKPLKWS